MSINNFKDEYTLNVDDYTIDELFTIIKYNGDTSLVTIHDISHCISDILTNASKKIDNIDTINSMQQFLGTVRDKLIDYISIRSPVQLNPTNYDVIKSQNIIEHNGHLTIPKVIPPQNVHEYKFPVGVINPIEKRTITKIISIDSVFRENYNTTISSNFIWKLPDSEQKVVSLKLASLELPILWYNISHNNGSNIFYIKTCNITGKEDITHMIELPSGNYMANTFVTTLNNYMINKGNGLQYLICEVDPITTKTVIRARMSHDSDGNNSLYNIVEPIYSADFYFIVDFSKNNNQYSLGTFLGFTNKIYEVHRNNIYTDYITKTPEIIYEGYLQSETSYGNGRINYIYIHIDDYNKNCVTSSIVASSGFDQSTKLGDSILGRVSINEGFSTTMVNNGCDNLFKEREYYGPVSLRKFHIKILDKYGNILDLNNNDISLALELTILYT